MKRVNLGKLIRPSKPTAVFGRPLEQFEAKDLMEGIPLPIYRCVEYICREGASVCACAMGKGRLLTALAGQAVALPATAPRRPRHGGHFPAEPVPPGSVDPEGPLRRRCEPGPIAGKITRSSGLTGAMGPGRRGGLRTGRRQ